MFAKMLLAAGAIIAITGIFLFMRERKKGPIIRSDIAQKPKEASTRGWTIDARYAEEFRNAMNRGHIAGHLVTLETIGIPPAFLPAQRPFDPTDKETIDTDPFSLVPRYPDWPEFLAPYPVPAIGIDALLHGEGPVMILGTPGSGRSTALRQTGLHVMQARKDLLPVFIDLRDVALASATTEEGINLVKALVNAAGTRVKSASRIGWDLQEAMTKGEGLLLLDSWDELSPNDRKDAIRLVRAIRSHFPAARIVMTGPVTGYAPLQLELGFTPVTLMPWDSTKTAACYDRWQAAWEVMAQKGQIFTPPTERMRNQSLMELRGRTPLDATLHIWSVMADDDTSGGQASWYEAFITRISPPYRMRRTLEKMAMWLMSHPEATGLTYDDASPAYNSGKMESDEKVGFADFMYALLADHSLMVEWGCQRLTFVHPMITAYLGACALRSVNYDADILSDESPLHTLAMPFLAQMRDVTTYANEVMKRSAEKPTIRQAELLRMARWIGESGGGQAWMEDWAGTVKRLLTGPSVYPALREQAACALAAAHSPDSLAILTEALEAEMTSVRILAALGLGAMGASDALPALVTHLTDKNAAVGVAATLAMGAIGNGTAVKSLIEVLLTGGEMARRASAEMLHLNLNGEGHDILQEAMAEQDHETRRAAIYGLKRIGGREVIELLRKIERLDNQWLVRNTAVSAIETLENAEAAGPQQLPSPQHLKWVTDWLGGRGEAAGDGPRGFRQMVTILEKGTAAERLASSEVLGQLVPIEAVGPLYGNLRDEHEEIRDAAYRSLSRVAAAHAITLAYPA